MTAVRGHPLVTAAITSYKAADTIERAIRSAQLQDWPNLEILVVDDASGDDTCAVIERVLDGITSARLVRHAVNGGPAAARNTLLAEAQGEFICFFDDDDESSPDRISQQVARLLREELRSGCELVACYASGQRVYPSGHTVDLRAIGSRGVPPSGEEVADYLLFYERHADRFFGAGTPTCSLLARRRTFDAVGGFDSALLRAEDADFAVRLALLGGVFVGTEERLFIQHATTAQDKSPRRNREAEVALAHKQEAYLRRKGLYYYATRWPELRCCHFERRYVAFAACFLSLMLRHPMRSVRHLLATAPRRLRHERAVAKGRDA